MFYLPARWPFAEFSDEEAAFWCAPARLPAVDDALTCTDVKCATPARADTRPALPAPSYFPRLPSPALPSTDWLGAHQLPGLVIQTTNMVHGPDGPTRGRAEAMWGWRRNRSSKAGKVLHMRSHEACCFSMMRTNVPDALMAMG